MKKIYFVLLTIIFISCGVAINCKQLYSQQPDNKQITEQNKNLFGFYYTFHPVLSDIENFKIDNKKVIDIGQLHFSWSINNFIVDAGIVNCYSNSDLTGIMKMYSYNVGVGYSYPFSEYFFAPVILGFYKMDYEGYSIEAPDSGFSVSTGVYVKLNPVIMGINYSNFFGFGLSAGLYIR